MSIPKASIIQTGRNQQQDCKNENFKEEEEFEAPQFVNEFLQNGQEENIEEDFTNKIKEPDLEKENNNLENLTSGYKNQKKSQPKMKYNIINLFWLVNEDLWNPNHNKDYNEAQFVTISYNMDFGNLKINYYAIPNGAIEGNVVFEQSLQRLISGTIYPSSCFRALKTENKTIICMEQLIKKTGEQWEKERPYVFINKSQDEITIKIFDVTTKNDFWFTFRGWQKEALEYCFEYTYKEGTTLKGICTSLKNIIS